MEHDLVVPYKENKSNKKAQVAEMFNNISHKYDFLNHFLSAGIDIIWRKKAISLLKPHQPKLILDVATGTGDFAFEALALNPEKIIGIDISAGMLGIGKEKILKKNLSDKMEFQIGDSENLDFKNDLFDAVIVSFGVRNFENLEKGLQNIYRVLKPGAPLLVLEFSKPKVFPVKQLYHFYFKFILPLFGRMISKDASAYTYLPQSVAAFPEREAFLDILNSIGYKQCKHISLTFGISSIYMGIKQD
jgi:demethylmenaquinone methyltransferase/2-methoxy-6-polyprenyl-1,4-benzoquinol methylase